MADTKHTNVAPPPEAWESVRRVALTVKAPIDRFMHVQASSGIVLLVAAIVAMLWANSSWSDSYEQLLHTPITIGFGDFVFSHTLHFWINDLLMAVFFLVVGLEIKRELTEGALSEWRRAALPIAAAIGGMVFPALIFYGFNAGGPGQHGWGVPMATDIAFAVGILTLLGKRVPAALRVMLLAIAIIDDIGAILVIAIFYSSGFNLPGLAPVAGGILAMFILKKAGVRNPWIYVAPGLALVGGLMQLGVHPTIAGVIAGLITPAKSWYGTEGFISAARQSIETFQQRADDPNKDEHDLLLPLQQLDLARREALSPARRIEAALHPYVAFGIMPVFALANAGVHLDGITMSDVGAATVFTGIVLGLVAGKSLGITLMAWISVRLGLSALPPGVTWKGLFVLGLAGGIGFTMAIFIAELAYPGDALLGVAKLGVLVGTAVAGILAYGFGHVLLPREHPDDVSILSASDLEQRTEYWTTQQKGAPNTLRPRPRDGIRGRM